VNKTTLQQDFKTLYLWIGICLAVCLVTGWVSHTRMADSEQNSRLQEYLDDEYISALNHVENTHPKEIDYQALSDSPYDILISKNDSIVFWNNVVTSVEEMTVNSDKYAILFRDIQNQYNVQIGLDVAPDGKLNNYLSTDLKLEITNFADASIQAVVKNLKDKPLDISTVSQYKFSMLSQVSYVFYLFLIYGILSLLYRLIFLKKTIPPYMGVLISFILYSSHRFYLSSFFENSYLAQIKNDISIAIPNLQETLTIMVFFAFVIAIVHRSKIMQKLPSELAHLLASFVTMSAFIELVLQIQSFTYSSPLSDLHNEALQYKWDGLFFILTNIFAVGLIFYASIVLFKKIKESKDSNLKYGLWIIGIALTYSRLYFVEIGIPAWTLYTFVFSYLLILELYIEGDNKNIIYAFWWVIIFSGFLASVTYYYRLHNNLDIQEKQIQSLYSFPQKNETAKIQRVDSILQSSNLFSQLSVLTYPSGLDINDYKTYVLTILQDGGVDIFRSQLTLEATDQLGITLFNNHFSTAYTFTKSVATANRISEFIYFNPFDNAYFLRYQVDNVNYTNSPFDLILKIQNGNKTEKKTVTTNYAIFKNENLVDNNILESNNLSIKDLRAISTSKIEDDMNYAVYNPSKDTKIISFSKIGGLIKPISLFSFIVSMTGFILFILAFANTQFKFLPSDFSLQLYNTSSLRTRIQMTIILLIVFSFLIIGVVTAFFFKNVLENNDSIAQQEDVTSILNDIRNSIEGVESNVLAASTAQSRIDEMAHVHGQKLAFFDENGTLMKTSFSIPKIAKVPYPIVRGYSIANGENPNTRVNLENGAFFMDFVPVYYKNQNNPYGYLGVSYRSQNNSNRSIREFLSTILNVYIFLFLIAGVLAILIGNSITKPLSILSNKLKEFKLGKTNQALDWNRKDEIGTLINEYNTLVEKLDESVSILAKTERDGAWREMAKQVAHEIKNPLTPMKLSIQYLDKATKANPEGAPELVKRVSATLIEQINNLSHIANEFSNFATMPKASNEKVVINEIVENVHDLFRKRDDMDIRMSEPITDLYVFVDRNQLLRIIINIVKNATQAIPTDRKGIIKVSLSKVGDMAVVSVKDNGSGIPNDMKDKVFTPNFTTKSSGTGLGLAISSNMIESFNGKIYFETEVDKGTEFFVEIPLMRLEDNYPEDQKRVSLD